MGFSPIYPEALHSTAEGYRWEGRTTADGDAGKYLAITMICEGSPQDPKLQLQMREVPIDDSDSS